MLQWLCLLYIRLQWWTMVDLTWCARARTTFMVDSVVNNGVHELVRPSWWIIYWSRKSCVGAKQGDGAHTTNSTSWVHLTWLDTIPSSFMSQRLVNNGLSTGAQPFFERHSLANAWAAPLQRCVTQSRWVSSQGGSVNMFRMEVDNKGDKLTVQN